MILSHTFMSVSTNNIDGFVGLLSQGDNVMKKQPERTEATKAAFVEAFMTLSENKPIEKITIQELANRAGYNRTTFYEYFKDINQLLSYIENEMILFIKRFIVQRIGMIPPEEMFIALFTDMYSKRHKYIKLLFGTKNYNQFSHKLKEILIPAFANQLHLSAKEKRIEYILDFYLSGIISMIARWITSEDEMSLEEFAKVVRDVVSGMKNIFNELQ